MADLTLTTSQVLPSTDARFQSGEAGEALTAGMPAYKKPSDSKWYKGDADALETALAGGITVCDAGAGQRVIVQDDGDLVLGAGAAPVVGETYVLSATAGKICPIADLTTGKYVTHLGVGKTGNKLQLHIHPSGIAKA
jgi:hypothetical protein